MRSGFVDGRNTGAAQSRQRLTSDSERRDLSNVEVKHTVMLTFLDSVACR